MFYRTVLPAALVVVLGLVAIGSGRRDTGGADAEASTTSSTSTTAAVTTTTTSGSTLPSTSSSTTSTTAVPAALFVSAEHPEWIERGSTARFRAECSRPYQNGDQPGIEIFDVLRAGPGFPVTKLFLTFEGDGFWFDWTVPDDWPTGDYTVQFVCDGLGGILDFSAVPPESSSGVRPFIVGLIPPANPLPVPPLATLAETG